MQDEGKKSVPRLWLLKSLRNHRISVGNDAAPTIEKDSRPARSMCSAASAARSSACAPRPTTRATPHRRPT